MSSKKIQIRAMKIQDYEEVFAMWKTISGFGIRSIDDSEEYISRFLTRNPGLSAVATCEDRIVGSILCGHDGRRGSFYHVCVDKEYRKLGVGEKMAEFCRTALQKEGINKVNLIAFRKNTGGNQFWKRLGWMLREDCNYYEADLNVENITTFMP